MSSIAAQASPSVMPTDQHSSEDKTDMSPTKKSPAQRYSSADTHLFSSYVNGSPSQAKRALEEHIADTDQRIQDASELGTTLVEQRNHLSARLKDVEQEQGNSEIGPELKQKLADLEREYHEVGRETARTFAPKARKPSADTSDPTASFFSADGRQSPTKMGISSRKQRNQQTNRVHDIEFATEISTSLLGQVRHLQNILAEKEEALKTATEDNARLQTDAEHFGQRLKSLDDNEQKFKDENWHLETQVHDLVAQLKDAASREQRITHSLNTVKEEKSNAEKEYADLREQHTKLADEHATLRKQHDTDVTGMKRNLSANHTEKETLQKRIDELASQNEELARVVAYRARTESSSRDAELASDEDFQSAEQDTPEHSPPPSPTKGTPRHGMLESETLKSSLHHAHRMIQNLKNNIHREKTEKIELRRMLQDARDELEVRRSDSGATGANGIKKKKSNADAFKKPNRPDRLGQAKGAQEELLNDPSWEDYDGSPTRSRAANIPGAFHVTDDSDAFDTANEKGLMTTETEGFHTGAESLVGDSNDELTETEETQKSKYRPLAGTKAGTRMSFQSTASDDYDDFSLSTPPTFGSQRYKYGGASGSLRALSETPTAAKDSPASFVSNASQPENTQNLAAELEDMGDGTSVASNTPSRSLISSKQSTPEMTRTRETSDLSQVVTNPAMVDAGMVTDPWEPQTVAQAAPVHKSPPDLAQKGASSFLIIGDDESEVDPPRSAPFTPRSKRASKSPPRSPPLSPTTMFTMPAPPLAPAPLNLEVSSITSLETQPTEPEIHVSRSRIVPSIPPKSAARRSLSMSSQEDVGFLRSRGNSDDGSSTVISQTRQSLAGVVNAESTNQPLAALTPTADNGLGTSRSLQVSDADTENSHGVKQLATSADMSSNSSNTEPRAPFKALSGNARPAADVVEAQSDPAVMTTVRETIGSKDEGTQTTVSSDEIEKMIKDRAVRPLALPTSPMGPPAANFSKPLSSRPVSNTGDPQLDSPTPRSSRRPGAGTTSTRAVSSPPPADRPPLPYDHKQTIATVAKTSSTLGAATLYSSSVSASNLSGNQSRPKTPNETVSQQTPLKVFTGSYSRPVSASGEARDIHTPNTRRSSVSSFASELDERFNMADYPLPEDFDTTNVDPRMIQAITQTMIGEYLWKYTRKAGRGDHSDNRHKRFFWIHPYTRTLYWSDQDPSKAGRQELKAKSVAIEAVRVVTDENPMPPGLHQKSIIVVTPGRSIKFTALTGNRHETWFNALSYLLLRSAPERTDDTTAQAEQFRDFSGSTDRSNTYSGLTAEDVAEFNPLHQGSSTPRTTASSRRSITSTTNQRMSAANRASATQGRVAVPTLAARTSQPATSQRRSQPLMSGAATPTDTPFKKPALPASTAAQQQQSPAGSERSRASTGRLSFSRLRPSSVFSLRGRGSANQRGSLLDPADVDQDSLASSKGKERVVDETAGTPVEGGSATDLTAHGHHHGHTHGDGLENVRACCDGKHDVGSLAHRHSKPGSISGKQHQ